MCWSIIKGAIAGVGFIVWVLLMSFLVLMLTPSAWGLDRCASLTTSVRLEHTKYFGLGFPYWYGVSQLAAESSCRTNVQAWDMGQGVAQFMPKTSTYIQSLMGEKLDPYNSKDAIRMQAFYMHRIHTKENWSDRLFVDYRIYNGGRSALYNEYKRAGILDPEIMNIFCQRKKIQFKWGILDLCAVNKEYAEKIYTKGQQYRNGPDSMRYW